MVKLSSKSARTREGLLPHDSEPYWRTKTLDAMSAEEWEGLCDGCGRCCLIKLEDEDTGEIHLTRLSCLQLDLSTCRCRDYARRASLVPDCITLTPKKIEMLSWLPSSCAYRRVKEGRDLAWWHPLISETHETVHLAGISVRGMARSEKGVKLTAITRYIIGELADVD